MDKILFVIKPHSIIDVITNSSTEIFIGSTNHTIEVIKELLEDLINLENKANNSSLTFEEVFREPYISEKNTEVDHWDIDINTGDVVIKGVSDNSIPYWMFEFIENNLTGYSSRHHLG